MRYRLSVIIYLTLLVLCFAVSVSCDEAAKQTPRLKLQDVLTFPGGYEEVAGSLFSPTAYTQLIDRYRYKVVLLDPGEEPATASESTGFNSYTFSQNTRFMMSVHWTYDEDGRETKAQYTLHELPGMRKIWTREGPLGSRAISDDGKVVVISHWGLMERYWLEFLDETGRLSRRIESPHPQIIETALAPSGAFFVMGKNFDAGKWEPSPDVVMYDKTGKELATHTVDTTGLSANPNERSCTSAISINPDESRIAVSINVGMYTNVFIMFDRQLHPLHADSSREFRTRNISFSPDNTHYALSSPTHIQLHETDTGKKLWEVAAEEFVKGEGQISIMEVASGKSGDRVAAFIIRRLGNGVLTTQALVVIDKSGNVVGLKDLGAWTEHSSHRIQLELAPDNNRVALRYWDGSINYYLIPGTKDVSLWKYREKPGTEPGFY